MKFQIKYNNLKYNFGILMVNDSNIIMAVLMQYTGGGDSHLWSASLVQRYWTNV